MSERCDDCGTELIDKCAVCGAPICCPLCCARSEITRLCAEIERMRDQIQSVVDEQAADAGLWFIAATVTEDYLQTALRRLHGVIEGKE